MHQCQPLARLRISFVLFATLLCVLLSTAQAQISLDALRRDGYGSAKITRPEPNKLLVEAYVNGHATKLVLDTGANSEGLIVEASFARELGVSGTKEKSGYGLTGKKFESSKATADSVRVGTAEIRGVPLHIGVLGAMHSHEERSRVGAEGLLANGFLRRCSAVIDLHDLRVYLRPPGTGRRADLGPALRSIGFAEVPLRFVGHAACVDVELNGVHAFMELDTGAYAGLMDPRFAAKAKAETYRTPMRAYDVAGEEREISMSRLGSFKIGGVAPLHATHLPVLPFIEYGSTGGQLVGLLGIDMLGPNGAIIDFGSQKLYFFPGK
jgi:hypothetical protein